MFKFTEYDTYYEINFELAKYNQIIYIDVYLRHTIHTNYTHYYGPYYSENLERFLSNSARVFCDRLLKQKAFW
jgi:hypothetical protein